jgi:hypothetical protein
MKARTSIWLTRFGYVLIGCVFMALAGYGEVEASGGAYRVGGPDEYGVVCYQSRSDTFSCVKVR